MLHLIFIDARLCSKKGVKTAPLGAPAMDERFCLQKAQEAEAIANAALSKAKRHQWEEIAKQYRLLAEEAAKLRKVAGEIRRDLRDE